MTVIEFLMARLDEVEASARPGIFGWGKRHVARHDRRQVEAYAKDWRAGDGMALLTVRHLVYLYRKHPDFQDKWLSLL